VDNEIGYKPQETKQVTKVESELSESKKKIAEKVIEGLSENLKPKPLENTKDNSTSASKDEQAKEEKLVTMTREELLKQTKESNQWLKNCEYKEEVEWGVEPPFKDGETAVKAKFGPLGG